MTPWMDGTEFGIGAGFARTEMTGMGMTQGRRTGRDVIVNAAERRWV